MVNPELRDRRFQQGLFWIMRLLVGVIGLAGPMHSDANLIQNADFSLGNVGFNSEYAHSPGGIGDPATYAIVADPRNVHGSAASFGDHSTGDGLMMAINGSTTVGAVVWEQTVSVLTGKTYDFATFISSWFPESPAQLAFYVNGAAIGSLAAPSGMGDWILAFATWNSGTSESAMIQIIDVNSAFGGNDFALDDLYFGEPIHSTPEPSVALLVGIGLALLSERRTGSRPTPE